MGNIVLLDDLTINKIAAGEVIERPSSVIKEMVENSIDAGATNITVEIKNGGISYIRVTDNGKGIAEDDLEIAFERHATSKIRSADDLNTVTSMGFRGEALASIASIAKVEMISKTATQTNGYKVVVEGGKILEKTEVGTPVGTSITVSNLFYNTPVRYKFLKKDYTEAGYIEDVITRIALVHPEISIKLINSGKIAIQTNGNGDLKTVIYSIYGKDIAKSVIDVNYEYEDIRVCGVIGKPDIARSNRSSQIFFVNKRYVRDKSLTSAAERAYKGIIPMGKFSFLVLNLEMNPSKVDVNVHPAKLEVRFEEENRVFKAVYHAIKDTLEQAEISTTEPKKIENRLFENKEKVETIVEQIYKARQLNGIPSIPRSVPMPTVNKVEKVETVEKVVEPGNVENVAKVEEIDTSIPEIQKSQEVLKKLQEMKEKLIQESPELKAKLEETEKNHEIIEEPKAEIVQEEKHEIKEEVILNEIPEEQDTIQIKPEEVTTIEEPIIETKKEEIVKPVIEPELEKIVKTVIEPKVEPVVPQIQEEPQVQEEETHYSVDTIQKEEKEENSGFSKEFEEMYLKLFGTKPVSEENEIKPEEEKTEVDDIAELGNNISMFDNIEEYQKPTYKYIGLIFDSYIVVEIDKEMYIIDQNLAKEKLIYDKIRENYYDDENKDSQLMLLPDIITLNRKQMEIAKDNMKMFRKAGFMVEEFGENTIKLTGVPEMCLELETKEMFIEVLEEINSVSRNAKKEVEEKFLSAVAHKVAENEQTLTTQSDIERLLDTLLSWPNPFNCPNGKSSAIKMSKYDIERKFARK